MLIRSSLSRMLVKSLYPYGILGLLFVLITEREVLKSPTTSISFFNTYFFSMNFEIIVCIWYWFWRLCNFVLLCILMNWHFYHYKMLLFISAHSLPLKFILTGVNMAIPVFLCSWFAFYFFSHPFSLSLSGSLYLKDIFFRLFFFLLYKRRKTIKITRCLVMKEEFLNGIMSE